MSISRRRVLLGGEGGILPAGYKQCAYIESSGEGECIATGVTGSDDVGVKMTFMYPSSQPYYGSFKALFGEMRGTALGRVGYVKDAGALYALWGGTSYEVLNPIVKDVEHTIEFNYKSSRKILLDGVEIFNLMSSSGDSYKYEVYLFGVCYRGATTSYTYYPKLQVSHAEVTDGSTIVRNMYAAYRTSDAAIGMYDILNDSMYLNAAGRGAFTKGSFV